MYLDTYLSAISVRFVASPPSKQCRMNQEESKSRFRLHWLSWLALLVLSACMTLIVIPGIVVPASDEAKYANWPPAVNSQSKIGFGVMLSHGWPYEYMQSDLHYYEPGVGAIAWTTPDAWAVGNEIFSFELTTLIIDLLVAGLVIACGTLAVEFWRRRRKGVWFSLFDILVAVGLVAIVTSWYQGHAGDHAAETHALKACDKHISVGFERRVQAPDWLVRLVGGDSQIPFCEHFTLLNVSTRFDPQVLFSEPLFSERRNTIAPTDSIHALAGFKRAEAIRFEGLPHPELPTALARLKSLRKLVLNYDNVYMRASPLNAYDRETAASINYVIDVKPDSFLVFDDSKRKLIQPKVSSIQTLYELDQLDQLSTLEVNLGYIPHAAWQAIPPLSKLNRISFASREIFIEDLVVLEQFSNLKQVWLSISATKEELESFQRTHPQLELTWDPRSEITSNQIVSRRFTNLRLKEWYDNQGRDFYYYFKEEFDQEELDLTDFKFTMEAVELVTAHVDLASVTSISIDRIDSVQTVNHFLKACSSLISLELHVAFPEELVDELILPKNLSLTLRQGDRTVDDLHDLIKKHQLSELTVYDSNLSEADEETLEEAWPDIEVYCYDYVPMMYQPEPEPNLDYMGGGVF